MSDKQWVEGISGMYVRAPTRGKFKGAKVYCARVYVKAHGKFRHFILGTSEKKSIVRLREIQVDPLAAWEGKKRTEVRMLTLGAIVDDFLATYQSRGGTRYYHTILKPVREFFETTPASTITPTDLDRFIQHRRLLLRKSDGERKVSESSIRKAIVATATCFKWAKRNGYVSSNPADSDSITRPAEAFDPQSVRWLTDGELTTLLSVAPPWLIDVIAWATETGMDKGKIRRLRWPELDLDRNERRITAGRFAMQRDKTGKPIRQVLSDGAVEALNRAAKTRHTSGVIFLDADGQPVAEKVLDWALACAYKAAKIAGCNFRTFRHTFATRALRRGIQREIVAKMMGHSTAFISERYMHVADDQLRAAAKAMSGPERIVAPVRRDRIAAVSGAVPPTVPPAEAVEAGLAQVIEAQARRGAGVAEQGCLLSSYTG